MSENQRKMSRIDRALGAVGKGIRRVEDFRMAHPMTQGDRAYRDGLLQSETSMRDEASRRNRRITDPDKQWVYVDSGESMRAGHISQAGTQREQLRQTYGVQADQEFEADRRQRITSEASDPGFAFPRSEELITGDRQDELDDLCNDHADLLCEDDPKGREFNETVERDFRDRFGRRLTRDESDYVDEHVCDWFRDLDQSGGER